jgi:hypothetical protein
MYNKCNKCNKQLEQFDERKLVLDKSGSVITLCMGCYEVQI